LSSLGSLVVDINVSTSLFQFHLCSTSYLSYYITNLIKRFSLKQVITWKNAKTLEDMFFSLSLIYIFSAFATIIGCSWGANQSRRGGKQRPRYSYAKDSILIVNKFNLPNFKYLMWVFSQVLKLTFHCLTQILITSKVEDNSFFCSWGILPQPAIESFIVRVLRSNGFIFPPFRLHLYKKKSRGYNNFVLRYIEDEVVE